MLEPVGASFQIGWLTWAAPFIFNRPVVQPRKTRVLLLKPAALANLRGFEPS